jgi:hypothetical protein
MAKLNLINVVQQNKHAVLSCAVQDMLSCCDGHAIWLCQVYFLVVSGAIFMPRLI